MKQKGARVEARLGWAIAMPFNVRVNKKPKRVPD